MKEETKKRRNTVKNRERTYGITPKSGESFKTTKVVETSPERTEGLEIVREMARAYIGTIEYYKAPHGGAYPHDEAVKQALSMNEWRRENLKDLEPEKVNWTDIAAVGEVSMDDAFSLWVQLRESAADELDSGRRAGQAVGSSSEPYALAQFYAIRDAFADQWQPNGGIESAMIDMLTIAFSLQMYWSTIAHQRALRIHNDQSRELNRYENKGWKSPFQYEADAVDQAYRLADGYNRQFLRVLRQLRDLRRYSAVIIQNNGGQVNVGAQQVNLK